VVLAGLTHRRVAGDQRAGGHPDEDREREIEGSNDAEHAVWLEVAHTALSGRRLPNVAAVAVVFLEFVTVVPEEVDRLVDLRHRLVAVLAVLERHHRRDLVLSVGDAVGRIAEDGGSFLNRGRFPLVERRARRRDGGLHVRFVTGGELPNDLVGVAGILDGERLVGLDRFAVDPQRMGVAELDANVLDGGLIGRVELVHRSRLGVCLNREFVLELRWCHYLLLSSARGMNMPNGSHEMVVSESG